MTTATPPALVRHDRTPGRWAALGVLVLAVLLVAVDATVLGLATPFISEDLKPSGAQLLWIGDVYSFVIAGLLVSMGGLGDRIGRKRLLLAGAAAFGAVSVLNAYATSPELLIAARALMGVAGATLMPSTLALIRNIFTDARERSMAIGIWASSVSAGAAVGPLIGGLLLEHFWWGSVFLINLPVMAVLVVAGARLLPESKNPSPGPWDLPSAALSLVGMIGTVYAIKEAAAHGASARVGAAAVLGVAALVWFVRRQRTLDSPLIDVRLFRNRGFSTAVAADLLAVLGLAGLVFFLSQFFQLVQGRSPLEAGLAELPATIGSIVTGLLAALAVRRTSVRTVVAGGLAAMGLALALLAGLHAGTGYALLFAALLLAGAGAGFAFATTSDMIVSLVPKEQAGAASAVSETAYELGAALGIALLGSITTGVYRGFVTPHGVPAGAAAAAHDSIGGAAQAAAALGGPEGHALLTAARDAFAEGLRFTAGVGAAVLLATAVAAWVLLKGQRSGAAAD
ncbi:MFS transporter [Actinomadura verrucosospora]|uniref:Multidrug resistance efflux pump n=1 Tax=Actinomadura verrucosospora TaxID=46165 RepID=A0A7D4A7J9_ACTVE|nr:MFS transporter [Actinomadura verrucosospora]QKG27004.1 Multidrug resistance efflux pump [Actinomadura verrucosospora]